MIVQYLLWRLVHMPDQFICERNSCIFKKRFKLFIVFEPLHSPWNNFYKQESPPAWTQEAYRPLCSKYSLCCPNWVPPRGGTRTPPGGVPGPPKGVPGQVPPGGGYPDPPRGGTQSGTPPGGGTRTPPPPLWTDKHLWKQYLPVVLRTRAVIKDITLHILGTVFYDCRRLTLKRTFHKMFSVYVLFIKCSVFMYFS